MNPIDNKSFIVLEMMFKRESQVIVIILFSSNLKFDSQNPIFSFNNDQTYACLYLIVSSSHREK